MVFPRVRAPQENWKIVTDYDVCAYLATLLLRLYAMYGKSRTILFFLVTFFVGNLGSTFVMLCALSIKGIGEQYLLLSVLASFNLILFLNNYYTKFPSVRLHPYPTCNSASIFLCHTITSFSGFPCRLSKLFYSRCASSKPSHILEHTDLQHCLG